MDRELLAKLGKSVFIQTLKPLKKTSVLKNSVIIGFDTEYNSHTHELLSIQFSYGKFKKLFKICKKGISFKELWGYVKQFFKEFNIKSDHKEFTSVYLVCHWSIAELQHIVNLFDADTIFEGKTYSVVKSFGKQYLHIIDFFEFFSSSLKKVGEVFGYEKMKYDTTNISVDDLSNPDFIKYALNDAYITEQMFRDFRNMILDKYGIDILKTKSVANTSMTLFRKHYLTEKIGNRVVPVRRQAMLSSWGGNNQCFIRKDILGKFKLFDINSSYPNSVIQIGILPRERDWIRAGSLQNFLEGKGGICHINFSFPKDELYPCLPVYKDGKLCYPLKGKSDCTLDEVKFAIECGADIGFKKGYFYKDGNSDLAKYMKDMLKFKNTTEGAERSFYKLMMNSIIGKFTQKIMKVDINSIVSYAKEHNIPYEDMGKITGGIIKKKVSLGSGFMPEWNTLILGYARATLGKAFRDNNALIGTTDSLIIEDNMKSMNVNGLHFELKAEADRLIALKTRVYAMIKNDKPIYVAHHGIHCRENLVGMMEKSLNSKTGVVKYDVSKIIKLRQSIRQRIPFGSDMLRHMRFNGEWDNKRSLQKDGTTVPFAC